MDLFQRSQSAARFRNEGWNFIEERPEAWVVSPWVAMSALQKGIRRGDHRVALHAASTLLALDPGRLWRRLVGISFEDIGFGDTKVVDFVTQGMGSKERKAAYANDWVAAATFVQSLCSAAKDRSADDLLIAAAGHPLLAEARVVISRETVEKKLMRVVEPGALLNKAIALVALCGDRWSAKRGHETVSPQRVWEALDAAGCRSNDLALGLAGYRKTREVLPMMFGLLSSARHLECRFGTSGDTAEDDKDPTPFRVLQNGVPSYAYDMFSHEGKAALVRFLKSSSQTALWFKGNIPSVQRAKLLGGLLFRVEGGFVNNRSQNIVGLQLKQLADTGFHGLAATSIAEPTRLLALEMEYLNDIRESALRAAIYG